MNPIRFIILFTFTISTLYGQEIAITFDDAPTSNGPRFSGRERTKRILRELKDNDVDQVAFFVVTGSIDAAGSERLRQYSDAGHLLANHTHRHDGIHVLGVQQYCADIQRADSILRPMKGFAPWFRYPFLDEGKSKPVRDSIRTKLKDLNLTNGYVTIDNYDWYINSLLKKAVDQKQKVNYEKLKALYIDHVWKSILFYDTIGKQTLGRSPKHVLLLHENDLSASFIGDLIKHIRSHGWKIISPAEAYRDPIAAQLPDVLFNGQGRIAAIAREKGIPGRNLVQESEDEVFLEELMKSERVFE